MGLGIMAYMDQTTTHTQEDWKRFSGGSTCGITEAARVLGVDRVTVWRMIEDGRLYGWRYPGARKYLLWMRQVQEMAARSQAEAVQHVVLVRTQMELSLF